MNFRILFREFLVYVSPVIHSLTPANSLCCILGINKESGRVSVKLCQYSSLRKVELVVKETSQTRRFLYVSACDGSEVLEAMFRYHHVPLHSCFEETGSRITVMCNEVTEAALWAGEGNRHWVLSADGSSYCRLLIGEGRTLCLENSLLIEVTDRVGCHAVWQVI
jgi:hypothetical protein